MKQGYRGVWVWLAVAAALLLPCAALADESFGDWTYTLNADGQAVVTRYNGRQTDVSLPWNIKGHMVGEIGRAAFAGNTTIESVKLPAGVTVIREDAFRDCASLRSVQMPSRLATIEDGAFLGCAALTEVALPESVAELGEACFDSRTKLIGGSDSIVAAYAQAVGLAYAGKAAETPAPRNDEKDYQYEIRSGGAVITSYIGGDSEVVIPAELGGYPVRAIGENAFSSCYSVETVVVPEGVTTLERVAFRYCTGLTEVQLPSSLRSIGDNAFYRCEGLEEITIPEGVTALGDRAFRGCLSLRRVTLPRSLKTIPWYAFFECHERLIIYGYGGSKAESYADQRGYGFVEIK